MNLSNLRPLLGLCGVLALAGCAGHGASQHELDKARGSYEQVAGDDAVLASAPKDVVRAGESLARAERLSSYWGSGEDVAHYAYLSQRYSAIAREHSLLAAQQRQLEKLRQEREGLQSALREARLLSVQQQSSWLEEQMDSLATMPTERGLVMTLGDVLFDTGRAELKSSANRTVLKLYQFLTLNPQRKVRIEGYTDSRGPAAENLELSRARAQTVADVLVELGVDAARIEVQGYGEAYPLAANASAQGRAENRRVEIVFSDDQGQLSPPRE
ncbi:OmpA family protein [Pseudomonas oryzae]|uniref:Outer membrane protein OmpA n=1 Tax=Pseudomonas oryzae TaxID=1392877 RepID=A0A1H1SDP7_9PSED|nr:OmpA family protein [Pseudomonas oryzae]SDS46051.1 Outer membrane protein OmpA [Pseudomonas oryzae]